MSVIPSGPIKGHFLVLPVEGLVWVGRPFVLPGIGHVGSISTVWAVFGEVICQALSLERLLKGFLLVFCVLQGFK